MHRDPSPYRPQLLHVQRGYAYPARTLRSLLVTSLFLLSPLSALAEPLQAERLTWAGVKLVANDTTVFVDPVGTDLWDGEAPEGLVPVTADTRRRYALITHAHNDHFDVETLKAVLGERGYVISPEAEATYIASRGLKVVPAKLFVPIERGGFLFTAVPAEDGLGAEQVSWVITAPDGQRILHAGDTLWHGQWRIIGRQYGPFDVAFLPINGARLGGEPPQETPFTMTPEQAVDAALILQAKKIVPIHYGLNDPPHYVEVDDPLAKLMAVAQRRGVSAQHLAPGESITLGN
jgi:L-ascorbate metabolism protein UlaG (beta-lactamase superfamily)